MTKIFSLLQDFNEFYNFVTDNVWHSRWYDSQMNSAAQSLSAILARYAKSPTKWGSDAFGQKMETNAAVLPNFLAQIFAWRLDPKASESGSLPYIVCEVFWISSSILKL